MSSGTNKAVSCRFLSCLLSTSSYPVTLFPPLSFFASHLQYTVFLTMTFLGIFTSPHISSCPTEQHSEHPSTCRTFQGRLVMALRTLTMSRTWLLPPVSRSTNLVLAILSSPTSCHKICKNASPVANVAEVIHLLKKIVRLDYGVDRQLNCIKHTT